MLSYNDKLIETNSLVLPHPRMHLRNFVLKPILDIDPNWIHPLLKKTVKELIKEIDTIQKIKKI